MRRTLDLVFASIFSALVAVGLYAFALGTPAEAAYVPVPRGSILYFNATTCPTGWTEFTAARGAYIVGLQSGGTLASVVGSALTNLENRATGVHGHSVSDPGHYHGIPIVTTTAGSFFGLQGPGGTVYNNVGKTLSGTDIIFTSGQTAGSSPQGNQITGLTVVASAGVAGTNAPYLQLLVCAKS